MTLDPSIPQRRAADPSRSVWVGASAGTGKTKVLTDRVLSLLLAGVFPSRLLCLTFTKAAAAEMSNRINDRLARWASLDDEALISDLQILLGRLPDEIRIARSRKLFAQVLDAPGGMRIETIHAFCQALLRRFPLEAGLAPHFRVMDERDSAELLLRARDEILQRAIKEGGARRSKLSEAIGFLAQSVHETGLSDLLSALTGERGRLSRARRHFGSMEKAAAALASALGVDPDQKPEDFLADHSKDDRLDVGELRRVMVAMLEAGGKTDKEKAGTMASWLEVNPHERGSRFDLWRKTFLTDKGEIRKTLCTKVVESVCPGAAETLLKEAERLVRLDSSLRALMTAQASGALMIVADALMEAYGRAKAAMAMLDYDDLILLARELLESDGGAAWVLYKLDGGVDHILIDEAQDTNPDQWAVAQALTNEFFAGLGRVEESRRTIFAVGDPKQSIYSFQRADPEKFEEMRRLYAKAIPAAKGKWEEVALTVSFRSTQAVLEAVDLVFNSPDGRIGVIGPGEISRHDSWRSEAAGSVELWPLVEPRPDDDAPAWKPPVERQKGDSPIGRLARQIAARIKAMLKDERLQSRNRPILPGDIMILVRRRGPFFEEMVRALKVADVPVAGADRMILSEQMAVMDLTALGWALLLPEDDLTLASVLKGPLMGLSEEELFCLAHGRKGTLIDSLRAKSGMEPYRSVLERFQHWGRLARHLPVHEFYAEILEKGGREKLLARLGAEAEDPLEEFVNMTLAFEQGHPPSLQNFLAWMEAGGVEIKRDLEASGSMVRIMTVHGAKGLQAPIVFLPDTAQRPSAVPLLSWLKRDGVELPLWAPGKDLADQAQDIREKVKDFRDQEYRRLFYVAMTRAEDHLIICGWGSKKGRTDGSWYDLAKKALQGRMQSQKAPAFAFPVERDLDGEFLCMTCPQTAKVDPSEDVVGQDSVPLLPDWAKTVPDKEEKAIRPLAPSSPRKEEPAARSPLGASGKGGASAFLRGQMIHRLLQSLPSLPQAAQEVAAARYLARPVWKLEPNDRAMIWKDVEAILSNKEWAALFGPDAEAEVPIVGEIRGRAISGRIDRLWVGLDEALIVDFKTNRRPPRQASGVPVLYLEQLAAYRALLQDVYAKKKISCAILWTDGPVFMPLSDKALDEALVGFEAGWS